MRTEPALSSWLVRMALCAAMIVCASLAGQAQTLSLTLSRTTIPFASADPDTTPLVSAPVVTVTYRVRNNFGNWQITLLATGNLSSGSASIPVSAVSWAATPAPPFQAGTMSASVAQRLAGGGGNVNPARTGQVTFTLANSWDYNVGSYSTVFTFTLIAP